MNLDQLKPLPVKSGRYLCIPNVQQPRAIVPFYSASAFRQACGLIKTGNVWGRLKKFSLGIFPQFLLRQLYDEVEISGWDLNRFLQKENEYHVLIRPWAQKAYDKYIIIYFSPTLKPFVRKMAFSDLSKRYLLNEIQLLKIISDLPIEGSLVSQIGIPNIRSFVQSDESHYGDFDYYDGGYLLNENEALHKYFAFLNGQGTFFQLKKHPYMLETRREFEILKETGYEQLFLCLEGVLSEHSTYKVNACVMHGDLGYTNIIAHKGRSVVLDWENGSTQGLPIDMQYFSLKKFLLLGTPWNVESIFHWLAIYQNVILSIRNGDGDGLKKAMAFTQAIV